MNFIDRIFNYLAGDDIIDLYFVLSDLIDVQPLTPEEADACLDGGASSGYKFTGLSNQQYDLTNSDDVQRLSDDTGIPIGKLVI